jgi:hypothetical protein
MRFPARALALLAAGGLLGTLLAPVAAQQPSSPDGQIVVRSDGAVYLLTNGQRRWVATVVMTDDELNAIPEAEPVYAGLAPADSGLAPRASGATPTSSSGGSDDRRTPTPTRSSSSSSSSDNESSDNESADNESNDNESNDNDSGSSSDVSIDEVTFDEEVNAGDEFTITAVVSKKNAGECELKIEWPDNETKSDKQKPDSDGVCEFVVDVPSDVRTGTAEWTLTFRDGNNKDTENDDFRVRRR